MLQPKVFVDPFKFNPVNFINASHPPLVSDEALPYPIPPPRDTLRELAVLFMAKKYSHIPSFTSSTVEFYYMAMQHRSVGNWTSIIYSI